jgi:catechol 2,3-dioxygenase-like lactoylglutathione lyase family enzyme
MLDHVGINVRDFATSRAFYAAALAPLGIEPIMEFPGFCGFGESQKPYFWIGQRDEPTTPAHVAFASPTA